MNAELETFARSWLAAWTGNAPARLAEFYAEDAYYQDPALPEGVKGRRRLQAYLRRLLARYPDWVWEPVELFATPKGFTLKWRATVPGPAGARVFHGMDLVEVALGKITRNEVYFDPAVLAR